MKQQIWNICDDFLMAMVCVHACFLVCVCVFRSLQRLVPALQSAADPGLPADADGVGQQIRSGTPGGQILHQAQQHRVRTGHAPPAAHTGQKGRASEIAPLSFGTFFWGIYAFRTTRDVTLNDKKKGLQVFILTKVQLLNWIFQYFTSSLWIFTSFNLKLFLFWLVFWCFEQMSWRTLSGEHPSLKPVQLHRILTQYQLTAEIGSIPAWQPGSEDEAYIYRTGREGELLNEWLCVSQVCARLHETEFLF